jgi:hypothetical protein
LYEVRDNIVHLKGTIKETKSEYKEHLKEDQQRLCGSIPVKQRKLCKENVKGRLSKVYDKRIADIELQLQNAQTEEKTTKDEIAAQKKRIDTMKKNDVSQEYMLMSKCRVSKQKPLAQSSNVSV